MQRHTKNRDTGTYNIHQTGEGLSDLFSKIASAVARKTAQNIRKKASTKVAEKCAEKIGEKTGQVVGEKIYDKFSKKGTGIKKTCHSRKRLGNSKNNEVNVDNINIRNGSDRYNVYFETDFYVSKRADN